MDSTSFYRDDYIGARRVLPTLLPANPATKGDNIVEKAFNLQSKVTMGNTNNESSLTFTGPGFVNYVYKQNSVTLGTTNVKDMMKKGTTVSRSNLKKGDLVFFNSVKGSSTPSIVAIYAGDHRIIIPNSDGILTKVLMVDYYNQHYITAKRVISGSSSTPTPETTKPTTSSETPVTTTKPTTPVTIPQETTTSADKIVNFASSLIGKAKFGYGYNEDTLTFTSAGFTYYVYKNQGIDLKEKLASKQAQVGTGTAVQKANLQKGDLLFFSTNNGGTNIKETGIYMGNNQYIRLKTNGGVVKESLTSTWAKQNYVSAKRVIK